MSIVTYAGPNLSADIDSGQDGYVLSWTDYVANDWAEAYLDLPVAVARLAVLVAIDQETFGPFDTMFVQPSESAFAEHAVPFLRATVTSYDV
jgi:hypothetical protein